MLDEEVPEIEILRRRLRHLHISQASVARALDPPVSRNAVNLALSGRMVSRRIIAKVKELVEEKERAPRR